MVYVRPKQQQTKELKFLHTFKESGFFDEYIGNNHEDFAFIEEPYTGFGYPDLVFLRWNNRIARSWSEKRNDLTIDDIKIVQHLYNSDSEKTIPDIEADLGYSESQLQKIFSRLHSAGIVYSTNESWILKSINEVFFIEQIITIEAKLKNWHNALLQARNSVHFSSEVYTLYPESIINQKIVDSYAQTNIGIISFDLNYRIVKPSHQVNLPITINGWLFNEFIGRMLWQKN